MDTSRTTQQIVFVADQLLDQGALTGPIFKFIVNKRLIEYFGSREVAYLKVGNALKWISTEQDESEPVLAVISEHYRDIKDDEYDDYESAWYTIRKGPGFVPVLTEAAAISKPSTGDGRQAVSFRATTGTLTMNGSTVDFEPKSVRSTILKLVTARPGTGVGFERISDEYKKYDRTVELSDKNIRDAIASINKAVANKLPDSTNFLKVKGGKVRTS